MRMHRQDTYIRYGYTQPVRDERAHAFHTSYNDEKEVDGQEKNIAAVR